MAKAKGVSVIEQHVEKGVLLVCLVVLGCVVYHWVLSSPRQVKIVRPTGRGTTVVLPHEADEKLSGAAKRIENGVEGRDFDTPGLFDWPQIFKKRRDQPFPGFPALAHLNSPRRPVKTGVGVKPPPPPSLAEIQGMLPAPDAPLVWAGAILSEEPVGRQNAHDITGADVFAFYPIGEVRKKWQARLRQTAIKPAIVPLAVEAELFTRNPDGTWPTQGEPVEAAARISKPKLPAPIPAYDGKNAEAVRKAVAQFGNSKVQQVILQPDFWNIWNLKDHDWGDWKSRVRQVPFSEETFEEQLLGDRVLVWLHDPNLSKVREYRYRIRLKLVNPLLTHETDLNDAHKADAGVAFVVTPWSRQSAPFTVPKQLKFFLIGYGMTTTGRIARVKVYAPKLGQWVSRAFNISPGQTIGSVATVKNVVHPVTKKKQSVKVDFSTGAVAVEFDFERPFFRRTFSRPQKTTQMIYLDDKGRLHSRIQIVDNRRMRNWEESLKPPKKPVPRRKGR